MNFNVVHTVLEAFTILPRKVLKETLLEIKKQEHLLYYQELCV